MRDRAVIGLFSIPYAVSTGTARFALARSGNPSGHPYPGAQQHGSTCVIEVQHITKHYGRVTAVDDVSFRVERGEILGFLGPNGAGKTTTMRILTGYMPPTEGKAIVAGFDVFEQPVEAKRRTG